MTKYDLMLETENYTDVYGNHYADILSYPINEFTTSLTPIDYVLNQNDIQRFDLLIYNIYGNLDYESFILTYNNIELISRLVPGDHIMLPNATDIDQWIRSHIH
jgi:hypothetical protein